MTLTSAGKAGIGITSNDGATIDGVACNNITMNHCTTPIFIKLSNQGRAPGTPPVGRILNIGICNVTATNSIDSSNAYTSTIFGYPSVSDAPSIPIQNVVLNNVNVSNVGGTTSQPKSPSETNQWQPSYLAPYPAYGWFLRHVNGISFNNNCHTHLDSSDIRPAILNDNDGQNITVDSMTVDATRTGSHPSPYDIGLVNVKGYQITNSTETGGAALRLSTSNSTASSIVSSPLFGVPGGAYASSQTVALTSATSGASIYYTTDGSTPSSSNGTLYTGPISITTYKTIIKSIATMSGLTNSAVNTAIYTITSVLDLPHFSLAGGSYTGPQTLTITSLSTLTDGASIRYTTDGTTPTSTNGTLYTGPITISATTTVYAVVYAPNFPNSAVVGATYALAAAPLTFQSTSLSYSATGASAAVQTDSNVPGGWVALEASSSGAYIECTLPSIPAGTYDLQMSYKTNSNRGILQMAVDGVDVGSPLDEYAALPSTYPTYDFGTVTFTASGSHVIRLTVTGKNSASSSYRLSTISFYLSTTTTTSPLTFQSTSLSYTATGASAAVQTDSNVPGGWVALEASSSGSYIEYTLPNIPTGTYDLQMSYKTNSNRGILQMTVDGVNVGSPLDEYATLPSTYPTHDFATVTFTAGGSHVIRLTVTGKNSASSSYQLSTISFYLYPSQ